MPEVQLLTRQLGGERRPGVEVNHLSTRVLYEPTVVFGSHVLTSKTTY